MTAPTTEIEIQTAIRLELGDIARYPDVLMFRNSCGVLTDRTGRSVRFGLANGSADLVGMFTWCSSCRGPFVHGLEACTNGFWGCSDPQCMRCHDGRALWIEAEIKTPKGKQDELQVIRQRLVESKGGVYVVLRSVDDARAWIQELRRRFA